MQCNKFGLPMTEMGHNRLLPHRSIGVRLCSVNRHKRLCSVNRHKRTRLLALNAASKRQPTHSEITIPANSLRNIEIRRVHAGADVWQSWREGDVEPGSMAKPIVLLLGTLT